MKLALSLQSSSLKRLNAKSCNFSKFLAFSPYQNAIITTSLQHRAKYLTLGGKTDESSNSEEPNSGVRGHSSIDINYLQENVKKEAYDTYLTSLFSNKGSREALWAIMAFNLELVKASANYSHPEIALLKLTWWNNTINEIYKGNCMQSPVARVLFDSINKYKISKMWFTRNIRARKSYVEGTKFSTIQDVEKFGEHTIASNIHAHLETLGVRNINADSGARLIGQAASIAYLLQNIPFMASSNRVEIPAELVQKYNLNAKEIRENKSSKSLENAVYDLSSIGFTRLCGVSEIYIPNSPKEAFPALLYAVPLISWFERLEKANFNINDPRLYRRPFSLPFRIWKAFNKKSFV